MSVKYRTKYFFDEKGCILNIMDYIVFETILIKKVHNLNI